jgi:hypothetical protein
MVDRPPIPTSKRETRPAPLFSGGSLVALTLAGVLLFGMGLGGALRWRTHRLMLQMQGALAGLVVGYVAGRLSAPRR